jgi:hypothetical protein
MSIASLRRHSVTKCLPKRSRNGRNGHNGF